MKIPVTLLTKLTKKSDHQCRHATIVFRGGSVVAHGYNHHWRHSEVVALSKLWPSERVGTTVINLRILKSGRFGNSRPCSSCLAFLLEAKVKKVYFSTEAGSFESLTHR